MLSCLIILFDGYIKEYLVCRYINVLCWNIYSVKLHSYICVLFDLRDKPVKAMC